MTKEISENTFVNIVCVFSWFFFSRREYFKRCRLSRFVILNSSNLDLTAATYRYKSIYMPLYWPHPLRTDKLRLDKYLHSNVSPGFSLNELKFGLSVRWFMVKSNNPIWPLIKRKWMWMIQIVSVRGASCLLVRAGWRDITTIIILHIFRRIPFRHCCVLVLLPFSGKTLRGIERPCQFFMSRQFINVNYWWQQSFISNEKRHAKRSRSSKYLPHEKSMCNLFSNNSHASLARRFLPFQIVFRKLDIRASLKIAFSIIKCFGECSFRRMKRLPQTCKMFKWKMQKICPIFGIKISRPDKSNRKFVEKKHHQQQHERRKRSDESKPENTQTMNFDRKQRDGQKSVSLAKVITANS